MSLSGAGFVTPPLTFQNKLERCLEIDKNVMDGFTKPVQPSIAPYSPDLNLIEILWRKIKYEWMPFSAYLSFANLTECLFEILASIGKSRTIAFA
jgi:hypothetical protein